MEKIYGLVDLFGIQSIVLFWDYSKALIAPQTMLFGKVIPGIEEAIKESDGSDRM